MIIISQIGTFENLIKFIPFIDEAFFNENHIYEISYIPLIMSKVSTVFQTLIQRRISEKYFNTDLTESLI
jgi:hypothetical protein